MSSETQKVTYRCRIYRYNCEELEPAEVMYVSVEDTLESPMKTSELPGGEIVFAVSDPSENMINKEVVRFVKRLGPNEVSDWNARGSI